MSLLSIGILAVLVLTTAYSPTKVEEGKPISPEMWGSRSDEDLWPFLHFRVITPNTFDLDIHPEDPSGTAEVPVTVIAWSISGPSSTTIPVTVAGSNQTERIFIDLGADEYDIYTVKLTLLGGREMVINPLAPPETHFDYKVMVDEVERTVSVHVYPDYTYLYVGLLATVVAASAFFLCLRRRQRVWTFC
jgi:hypothetical protein